MATDIEAPPCNVEATDTAACIMPAESTTTRLALNHKLTPSEMMAVLQRRLAQARDDNKLQPKDFNQVHTVPFLYKPTASIVFKDLSFTVKAANDQKEKVILEPCSGCIEPGSMVALMGPSGSGKSTLLDMLANKKTGEYGGSVYLNGHPRDETYDQVCSYVAQQDIMPEHWTVKEAVAFNALLRRPLPKAFLKVDPKEMKESGIGEYVMILLESLGLENVADTPIGGPNLRGISGGQRRRVTLARGLAAGAHVLFADEPTSGLSSTDAETVVQRLKLFSIKFGMSVVIVIHQPKPEVAALFDCLILLTAQPGRVVYNGPMNKAFQYYADVGFPVPSNINPVDYFLDLVTPGYVDQQIDAFVQYFKAHAAAPIAAAVEDKLAHPGMTGEEVMRDRFTKLEKVFGELLLPKSGTFKYMVPLWLQLRLVFGRHLTLKFRDKKTLLVDCAASIFKALILGIAFFGIGDQPPAAQLPFIFLLVQMAVIALLQEMGSTIEGRTVMKYEASDRLYREELFLVATSIFDTVKFVLNYIIYLVIAFSMAGMSFDKFPSLLGWSLLGSLVFASLFGMASAIGKDMQDAQVKAIPMLILFMLFNGYFVTLTTVVSWMKWSIYISPLFYVINQVAMATFNDGVAQFINGSANPAYQGSGQSAIDMYGFYDMPATSLAVLLSEMVVLRVLQAIFLKKFNNIQR